jgi:hypothetical protein
MIEHPGFSGHMGKHWSFSQVKGMTQVVAFSVSQ